MFAPQFSKNMPICSQIGLLVSRMLDRLHLKRGFKTFISFK